MTTIRRTAVTTDDCSLLEAAKAGDEQAFGRLAERHRPGLELYCQLMLGCPHEAHQAVQETLLRGWCRLHRLEPSISARMWLYRLATDVCVEDLEGTGEFRGPQAFDPTEDHGR
jgi:RNA polymerase sigma-70 factor (ECF subfamily)